MAGGETSDAFDVPGVESQQALDVLTDDFPAAAGTSAQLVFAAETGTLDDPGAAAAVDGALDEVAAHPHVGAVGDLQRSPDGTIGYVDVQYDRPSEEIRDDAHERLEAAQAATNASGAVRVELGGDLPTEAAQDEPSGQEVIGVAMAVVVLLVAFGSVIAMGLPIGLALVGLATSTGLIGLVAAVTDVISVAPVLAAMIGLGVGIDYALFIVTRHREHLRAGMTVDEAAGRAIATAGSAVMFAGATVVIAICGLAIAGIPAVTVMGLMAGLAVAVMVALALTLLPALLGFAGARIDAIRLPGTRAGAGTPGRESLWHRWGRQVAAHPWRYLTAGALALVLLAAPVAGMRLGMTDNGVCRRR
ncbi:MAG TPA: MMPL family transporter [Acidimicrobiales bacterium]